MTSSGDLAERAVRAAREVDVDTLRARLLFNLCVAQGYQDAAAPVVRALAQDRGPGIDAFRLAARMHARTQDDFYPAGRVHIGAVVIPAVLAVGRGDVRPAVAAGYEVLAIVSEAHAAAAQERGLRPTGVFGPLGAAAAAAIALRLDADGVATSIGLASAMAGGTNQSWLSGTDEWLVEVAVAARAGVDAARLAAAGVRASDVALEGPAGWSRALFDEGGGRLAAALQDETPRLPRVAIKPYPISGIAQVPTAVAVRLHGRLHGRRPDAVTVRMNPAELAYPGSRNSGPFRSRSDSLMSVARCVALALTDGAVSFAALGVAPSRQEAEVLEVIQLVADEDLEDTEAAVEVVVDGEVIGDRERGGSVLHPTWRELEDDLTGLSRRVEAELSTVVAMCHAVATNPTAEALRPLAEEH